MNANSFTDSPCRFEAIFSNDIFEASGSNFRSLRRWVPLGWSFRSFINDIPSFDGVIPVTATKTMLQAEYQNSRTNISMTLIFFSKKVKSLCLENEKFTNLAKQKYFGKNVLCMYESKTIMCATFFVLLFIRQTSGSMDWVFPSYNISFSYFPVFVLM